MYIVNADRRLSKISVTFKTDNGDDSESCKLVISNHKEVALI